MTGVGPRDEVVVRQGRGYHPEQLWRVSGKPDSREITRDWLQFSGIASESDEPHEIKMGSNRRNCGTFRTPIAGEREQNRCLLTSF